jgi:hypothetical protein
MIPACPQGITVYAAFCEVGTVMSRRVESNHILVRDAINAVGLLLQIVGTEDILFSEKTGSDRFDLG